LSTKYSPLLTGAALVTLAASVLLHCGCRRSNRRGAEAPPPPAEAPAAPAAPVPSVPAEITRVVEELNYALQDHRERTGKMPRTVDELFTAAKLRRPPLPPGAQIRINERFKMVEFVPAGTR
jgi:hypothetical protein